MPGDLKANQLTSMTWMLLISLLVLVICINAQVTPGGKLSVAMLDDPLNPRAMTTKDPNVRRQLAINPPNKKILAQARVIKQMLRAARALKQRALNGNITRGLGPVGPAVFGILCPGDVVADEIDCTVRDTTVPSMDGSCNNFDNPTWGMSGIALRRLLPADYEDTVEEPRLTAVGGEALPNVRLVSTTVHMKTENIDPAISLMVMQWGQFLDHDITLTPTLAEA
ncbi:PREDICTED: myeloperoxidase-like [Priapulus caudatus]|uniref:Myeloperoxidase-like n=1 Tax=Priapulus caudatus TaxID=37621 RepID=A0ABM1EMM4_PRICU|nr:PREDICTED: myeloperoxidase-like [Priapulus caudatus]